MARADDPRIYVRCSRAEFEAIERAAKVAGVATGALVRDCALRWGPVLAAEIVSKGEIKLRQRNAERLGCRCRNVRGPLCPGCRIDPPGTVRAVTPQGPRPPSSRD